MMRYSEEKINIFRLCNCNIYQSKEICTGEKIYDLIKMHIGLHAARITKPFISLLNKGVTIGLKDIYNNVNFNNNYMLIRCMRRTLHYCPLENLPIVHYATKQLRLPKINDKNSINKSKFILEEELSKNHSITSNKAYKIIGKSLNLTKLESKRIFNYHWENGLLCLKNENRDVFSCTRKFYLTSSLYDINYLEESIDIQCYINQLVFSYIDSFGPVSIKDICWWSGLGITKVKIALDTVRHEISIIQLGRSKIDLFITKSNLEILNKTKVKRENWCKFMAYEDSSLKAFYETRFLYCDNPKLYFNSIGEIYATILFNGKCIGVWNYSKMNKKIEYSIFDNVNSEEIELIEREKERMQKMIFDCYI